MKMFIKRFLRVMIVITSLTIISIIIYILLNPMLSYEEALMVGEEKYLDFLWMVDGAFNNERYHESFSVNGKSKVSSKFTCNYSLKNNNLCVSDNFKDSFEELFSSKIHYETVYGDGTSYNWFEEKSEKFIFNNANFCSNGRMSMKHYLEPLLIERNKITYKITFVDDELHTPRFIEKIFILRKENRKWKVFSAYYHDPCYMDYNV